MPHKPLQLLLLAASLSALPLRADSDPVIQSFDGSGNLSWSNSAEWGLHRVEWASSLTGPWQSTWSHLTGIPANGGVSQASVPMFYRVVWYEDGLPSHAVTTNMVQFGYEQIVSNDTYQIGQTGLGTAYYSGVLRRTPVIPESVTITMGSCVIIDNGSGLLTMGGVVRGYISYVNGGWYADLSTLPEPGVPIIASYTYTGSEPRLLPELTVAGEPLGESVSGATDYAGVLEHVTVQAGSLTIFAGGLVFYDTGMGLLVATGGSGGNINYDTGLWRLSIAGTLLPDLPMAASYRALDIPPDEGTPASTEVAVVGESLGLTGYQVSYNGFLCHAPVVAGSAVILANGYAFIDNGSGVFLGSRGGTISYEGGGWRIDFGGSPSVGIPIAASYKYLEFSTMPPPVRILNEPAGTGIAGCSYYVGKLAHTPVPGSLSIVAGGYGFGEGANGALLSTHGTGTIYHAAAVWVVSVPSAILSEGEPIKASYKHW